MTDSLAHVVDMPAGEPWGRLVVLHGAGSRKENHADMAAAAAAAGLAVVRYDARGHGATGGRLDGRALEDVARAAALLPPGLPLALRGSSMGGYVALVAAAAVGAAAVVAICPAGEELLARGLRDGRLSFPADRAAVAELLAAHRLEDAVAALRVPVLIQHAEGDADVPVSGSRALVLSHPPRRWRSTPAARITPCSTIPPRSRPRCAGCAINCGIEEACASRRASIELDVLRARDAQRRTRPPAA